MQSEHRRSVAGERATLNPFEALAGDVPPRDQRDLMERPFFALGKTRRVAPILYQAGAIQVQVYAVPEHGMATIWDADVLIWAASQILAAQDRGLATSRFFRFTPYQLLIAIGRATGNREYQLLKGALTRLQSTVIRTTIRQGEHWRRQQFSWINEWEELTARSGRCEGMEFVLPEWFYQGVLDRRLVLAIDPAYFALSGGIERWLYRVARKHAGRQRDGWRFDVRHLHAKSASLARFSDFALDIRRIVARQPLPGYALALQRYDDGRELIAMRPHLSTGPVDRLWTFDAAIGTSGATGIGISGASVSGHQAQGSQASHSTRDESIARKDSKSESKSSVVADSHRRKARNDTSFDQANAVSQDRSRSTGGSA
jgi:plasmid replication initiation protein